MDSCYSDPVAEYQMDETTWSGVSVFDSSGNSYNGESRHGAETTPDGKVCRGGVFTDSGDHDINDRVKLPYQAANGLKDFAVSVWIKTGKNGSQAIISGANGSQNNEFLIFFPNGSTISTYLKGPYNSYSASVANGAWHHIVWMREGEQENVYMDGVFLGANTVSGSPVNISPNGLYLASEQDSVGGGWNSAQEFVGTMDEVKIYDRALSYNEVRAIFEEDHACN